MATGFPLSINVGDPVARAKARPPAAPKASTPKAETPAAPKDDLASRYTSMMEQPKQELKEAVESEQRFGMAKEQDLAARTAEKARSRATALGAEKTAIEESGVMQRMTDVEKRMETPFTPTKDNAMDLATLYSLIGVVGFAIGSGGKGNALTAMSAMNGMAQGYQQGRMDLYAREKDQFDTNLKQLKTRADTLGKELERITKLAAYDRQSAELEADALFAEQGANFMKEYTAKYGLPKSLELAKQNVQSAQKIFELKEKQEADAKKVKEDRAFRMQMAQMNIDARKEIALMKSGAKGGQKLTEKDRSAHRLREGLIPQLSEGIDTLDRLNQEGKWSQMTTLLALPGRGTEAAEYAFRNDPAALNLIRTFALFRSKEFETAGKALTQREDQILRPLYRADLRAYEGIRNAMVQGVSEMAREKAALEDQFPSLGGGVERPSEVPTPKPMPTGDKLKAYADANFAGDQTKAQNFLRSQGFQ
jgi:hypothetical protein